MTSITTTTTRIGQALMELIETTQRQYAAAEGDVEERKYWRAQRNAFINAQADYLAGRSPLAAGDTYLMPSASRAGAYHRCWREGGIWMCSCEAGERGLFHRHTALIAAIEYAAQPAAQEAPAPEPAAQCPHCCASAAYADRCPAAQLHADALARQAQRLQLDDRALVDRLIARVAAARARRQAELTPRMLEAA